MSFNIKDKDIDDLIKYKMHQKEEIPERTKHVIDETLNSLRTRKISKAHSNIVKYLSIFATVLIVFLGVNVYAHINDMPNIFSYIGEKLNIDKEQYEKEKIEIKDEQKINIENNVEVNDENKTNQITSEETKTLTLNDYAYNEKILIVNFIYKDNKEYNDLYLEINPYKFNNVEEGSEYPNSVITHISKKEMNGVYQICMVYDLENVKIINDKVNLEVVEILNETGTDYGIEVVESVIENLDIGYEALKNSNSKALANFEIDLKQKEKQLKSCSFSGKSIKIDLKSIGENAEAFGTPEIKILEIANSELLGIMELYSDADIIRDTKSMNYESVKYSFEITDQNGLNVSYKNGQELQLSYDLSKEYLIIKNLKDVTELNIKVYDNITGNVVGTQKVEILQNSD